MENSKGGMPKPDIRQTTISVATALNSSFDPGFAVKVLQVTMKGSASVSENLTMTLDSLHGSGYDTLLYTLTGAWTNGLFSNEGGVYLARDSASVQDKLVFACTNAASRTISLVITYEVL